jgi:protein-S-isoprenylcysteine O-methyltransferase Ste14
MEQFYPAGSTAMLYFLGHWLVAWMWLLKDAAAPDKGFDSMRLNLKGVVGVWIGALGPYWVAPIILTWRHIDVPLWWATSCAAVAICGAILTYWSDVHKAHECEEAVEQHKCNFLVDTGPWAWSRHPGYFGELLSYGALAAMPAPCFFATGDWWALLPLALLAQVWVIVMIPNLCRLEAHMEQTRGSAWCEYAARVPVLIPWPRVSWRLVLAAATLLPIAALTWSAWQ